MNQCERCGIDEDDPRAQQACAAVDSPSPYHSFPLRDDLLDNCERRLLNSITSVQVLVAHGESAERINFSLSLTFSIARELGMLARLQREKSA